MNPVCNYFWCSEVYGHPIKTTITERHHQQLHNFCHQLPTKEYFLEKLFSAQPSLLPSPQPSQSSPSPPQRSCWQRCYVRPTPTITITKFTNITTKSTSKMWLEPSFLTPINPSHMITKRIIATNFSSKLRLATLTFLAPIALTSSLTIPNNNSTSRIRFARMFGGRESMATSTGFRHSGHRSSDFFW